MEDVMQPMRQFLFTIAALLSFGTAAAAQDAPMEIAGTKTVNAQQVFDLVAKTPEIVILDNRKEDDYAAGHIEGAVRLIDTDVNAESLAQRIKSKDTPVLFYCNGVKCGRAAKAAEKAVQFGYIKVYYYALGMDEWNAQRLPLVRLARRVLRLVPPI
jgi:rhodanese-related sulfurtransferase